MGVRPFIAITLLLGVTAAEAGPPCILSATGAAKSLTEPASSALDKVEVSAALKTILVREGSAEWTAELARLDSLLNEEVAASVRTMAPKKRRNFFAAIHNSKPGMYLLSGIYADIIGLGATAARVSDDKKTGLFLVMDVLAKNHPMGRLSVRHETSHLSRMVSEYDTPKKMIAYSNKVIEGRKFGLYREEVAAFRDEYRYLRRTYTAADLPRLRKMMPLPDRMEMAIFRKKGVFVDRPGGPTLDFKKVFSGDAEVQAAFRSYMTKELNAVYLESVEAALTMTEGRYIKANMEARYYQEMQRAVHERQAKKGFRRFFFWERWRR